MGLFLGRAVAPAIMIALVSGVLAGVAVIWTRGVKAGRKTAVPFGPFLAFGAVVAVYAGQALVDAYLGSVH
jgi:leader peptidase (prepilin peptidase)/N-methyltransferase